MLVSRISSLLGIRIAYPRRMRSFVLSLLLLAVLTGYHAANAVTAQQIDSFIASGDKCLSHHLDRYIWVHGKDTEWLGQSFSNRYRTTFRLYQQQSQRGNGFQTALNGPWDRALVPTLEAQRDAILDSLLTVDTTGSLLKGIDYDKAGNIRQLDALEFYLRQNVSRKLPNMIQAVVKAFGGKTKNLDELLTVPPDKDYTNRIESAAAITAACAQLSLSHVSSCVSATNALVDEANYRANMILPNIWNEFIRTKRLRDGVRQSALIMLGRIKSQTPGLFFDDLVRGFHLAGFPSDEARDAAWRLLALYGNGGANTGYRILAFDLPPDAEVLGVSLSLIGTAVTYLDFQQRMVGGRHYALPPELSGSCLTPKPYHFWLNAYFSRWLVRRGYSAEVAQYATFIVDKGYQVNRDVNNAGGGIEKLLSKPTDHPSNEVIRIDLNLAAAGAVYGSLVERQPLKPFSLEEGLIRIQSVRSDTAQLSQRSILDHLVSDRISLIKTWEQLYQPNEALRFFQSRQK